VRRPLIRLSGLVIPIGAAAVALSSAGPAAAGTGYGQLIVNPGTVAPGGTVSVLGTCPNNGTGLKGVYSAAFVGGSATVTRSSINFSGSATVMPGASGKYTVTADCGTGSPSVTITVSGTAPVTTTQPATTDTTQPAASPTAVHTTAAMTPPASSTGPAAIVGGTRPAKPKSPSATAAGGAAAAASGTAPAPTGNGPITSTGIVRVGLAGSSNSALTMAGAAAIAMAVALAGGVGFLVIRRRRTTPGSHI
jgi:hypothetical protein